ncbi:MAG: hypothetical protein AAFS06_18730 [Cyanobacteria bacterium J06631_12]
MTQVPAFMCECILSSPVPQRPPTAHTQRLTLIRILYCIEKIVSFDNADTGRVQDVAAAIAHLKQLTVFDIPTIQKFYFDDSTEFEGVKRYINSLDYLRLLVLDYLQSTSVEETVAA